jgi:hypothetical protein
MLHDGTVGHRKKWLGHAGGHRAKACALTAGHYDGLHVGNVLLIDDDLADKPTA